MGQMVGADPEQLDTLGNQMSTSADRLDSIRGEISALLSHSHWDGPDADDFRNLWHHRLSALMSAAAHATRDGAHTLHTNATQQREASSADGGMGMFSRLWGTTGATGSDIGSLLAGSIKEFVDGYHGVDGLMTWLDGIGLVSASMSYFALGKGTAGWARALGAKINSLPNAVKIVAVNEAKSLSGLKNIAPVVDKAGTVLSYLGLGVSAFDLGYNLAKDPGSPETVRAGIDVAFNVASIAALECPPAGLAIFAVHQGVDYLLDHHPEVTKAMADGMVGTAHAVADAAITVGHAGAQVVANAEHVGKSIVSGGVNAVKSLFHW
jgi:hypothetical protein